MQLKFADGVPQHTLLKNRIKAMYISKSLITDEISRKEQFPVTIISSEYAYKKI